jgi:hypothetical protein
MQYSANCYQNMLYTSEAAFANNAKNSLSSYQTCNYGFVSDSGKLATMPLSVDCGILPSK